MNFPWNLYYYDFSSIFHIIFFEFSKYWIWEFLISFLCNLVIFENGKRRWKLYKHIIYRALKLYYLSLWRTFVFEFLMNKIVSYEPPIFALYAIPTPQNLLNATAATSPAHLVPCLLSPSSLGLGSSSSSFISQLAALS